MFSIITLLFAIHYKHNMNPNSNQTKMNKCNKCW